MPKDRILVVEDEDHIRELVVYNLKKEGFEVEGVGTAEKGLTRMKAQPPALLILDLMLPGADGLTLCRQIKADDGLRAVPVIMLTAKGEEIDVVSGLEVGADDYVTKPFSPRVLVARVRAVLRRGRDEPGEQTRKRIKRGQLVVDAEKHEVLLNGKVVDLTFTEFKVLELLARRPGVVFSRYQIVDGVRGNDYPVTDRSVDVQIVGLRKKLGKYSEYIQTVRGVGYRFRGEYS